MQQEFTDSCIKGFDFQKIIIKKWRREDALKKPKSLTSRPRKYSSKLFFIKEKKKRWNLGIQGIREQAAWVSY